MSPRRRLRRSAPTLGRNERFVLERIAQHMAAAPKRLHEILAVRCVGELLAQLADENVDDLAFGLIHPAVEMVEEHFLGQRRALLAGTEGWTSMTSGTLSTLPTG